MRRIRRASSTALLALLALLVWTTTASAASVESPLAQGLVVPLQFAVSPGGDVYVGQSFAGLLTEVGNPTPLAAAGSDGEIAGVDVTPNGRILYTSSAGDESGPLYATLNVVKKNGTTAVLADLLRFEQTRNPDQINSYGFQDASAQCRADLIALKESLPPEIQDQVPDPDPYNGLVDAHPYAVAALNDGRFVVADAGGNDLVLVNGSGQPRAIAVLPPQPLQVGDPVAVGLPSSCAGATYNFEPVPTDVEVGPDGMLYVTTLPGGPEGPQLGARGSVYRVDPRTGATSLVATGFLGATNLAVTPDGTIYVAEMFGNRVSEVIGGAPVPLVSLPVPAGLEYRNGTLYVSYDVLDLSTFTPGPGYLAVITP